MSILFNGYYGNKNTGDDIFCIISEWAAKKYWKQNDIKFFGRNLPRRMDNSELKSVNLNSKIFKGQSLFEFMNSAAKVDTVIFSGGSLFNREINFLSTNNVLDKYLDLNIVKAGALGISLGPYRSNKARESIKNLLSKFSFISLRDKRSFEEAKNLRLGIPIIESFDLGALLPEVYPKKNITSNKKPVVGISICRYESYTHGDIKNEERRFDQILETIKYLANKINDVKIKFLVFNGNSKIGDNEISDKLIRELPNGLHVEKIQYNYNPYLMWKEVNSCNVILATRMHAGIFSCFSNTPFVQVEYHKKCTDFLVDLNYPNKFRIGDIECSSKEVGAKLIELLENDPFANTNIDYLKDKAAKNFTLTKKYLSE